jgi:hypothetical protein
MPRNKRQQLQRRAWRLFVAAFPLAHKTRGSVKVTGEHGLTRAFALPQAADFFGRKGAHRRPARPIERSHGLFLHDISRAQPFRRFVDRGHHRATIRLGPSPPPKPRASPPLPTQARRGAGR